MIAHLLPFDIDCLIRDNWFAVVAVVTGIRIWLGAWRSRN